MYILKSTKTVSVFLAVRRCTWGPHRDPGVGTDPRHKVSLLVGRFALGVLEVVEGPGEIVQQTIFL